MDSELLQAFLAQAESYLPTVRNGILVCAQGNNACSELKTSLRRTEAVKDAALAAGLGYAARLATQLTGKLEIFSSQVTPLTGEQSRELLDKLTELEASIAHLSFSSEDFSIHINDFLDASFEHLGLQEPTEEQNLAGTAESADEMEEKFEIDEEMLAIFSEEAEELIQNIRANLDCLEKNTNDREALLEVRRNAHTLKGSAGIVNLKRLSEVAHRVEDLLDYLAENEISGNEKIFELLMIATDCFSALANGETSVQLSRKIAQLYEHFDALMPALMENSGDFSADASIDRSPELNIEERGFSCSNELLELKNFDEISSSHRPLKSKDQAAENRKSRLEENDVNSLHEIANHKPVVRVSLEKLDELVKIMSGLVISRSVFEQRLAEFEQQIGELHNSTRRLRQSTNKIETDFEADMLQVRGLSSVISFQPGLETLKTGDQLRATGERRAFDSLELDRYTDFHQTMRELIETTVDTSAINVELDSLKGNFETLFENQQKLIEQMQDKLLRLRLVTFGSLSVRLQRTVRMTADEEGKSAELTIEGENLEVDTQILDNLIEPLLHLLRNAVAHGIEVPEVRRLVGKPETGKILVRVHDEGTHFILTVTDDGRGIAAASLKTKAVQHGVISEADAEAMSEQEAFSLVFHAGLTTSEEISQVSGRGVGMNIVKNALMRQQGTISIESEAHKGTTFTIRLPMALAVTRALLVKAGKQTFAFPLKIVKQIKRLAAFDSEFDSNATAQPATTRIFHLNDLLGFSSTTDLRNEDTPLLVLKTKENSCALLVDQIIKPEEIVIKPLGNHLQNLPGLLGATILGDGSVVPVLDLFYLLKNKITNSEPEQKIGEEPTFGSKHRKRRGKLNVLIVDDSPSVRHLTSNVIKSAGWKPVVAKDGLEALDVLQDSREPPDIVLTDVEMPRMNGYELLAAMNKQAKLKSIPVVMITSRANQKHCRKGLDLGASKYLIKPFDEAKLIETIKELTG